MPASWPFLTPILAKSVDRRTSTSPSLNSNCVAMSLVVSPFASSWSAARSQGVIWSTEISSVLSHALQENSVDRDADRSRWKFARERQDFREHAGNDDLTAVHHAAVSRRRHRLGRHLRNEPVDTRLLCT